MSTRDRLAAGTSRHGRRGVAIGASGRHRGRDSASLASCGSSATAAVRVGRAPQARGQLPRPRPLPTAAPPPAYADTLRIGGDLSWYRGWWVGVEESGVPALTFGQHRAQRPLPLRRP